MKRYLILGGLCVAFGCSPSDSGDPAPADNSTSQVETVKPVERVAATEQQPATDAAVTKNVNIEVEGMVCGIGCVAKVKDTLGTLPGVETVDVDFATKLATVTSGGTFDSQRAIEALSEAGFQGTVRN